MSEQPIKVMGAYTPADPWKELQLRDLGTEFYGRRLMAYCTEAEQAKIRDALQSILLSSSQAEWDRRFKPKPDAVVNPMSTTNNTTDSMTNNNTTITTITTIEINGVMYVRADSLPPAAPEGNREVVVLDKGFIFVGNVTERADGGLDIVNASNIRRWSSGGFGGMLSDPVASGVVLDKSTAPLSVPAHAVQQRHAVSEEWGQ